MNYLNCFCNISMCIHPPNEEMVVDLVVKRPKANRFSETLIRNKVDSVRLKN